MIQNTDYQMSLYRARLLLEEGRNEAALAVLETINAEDEKQQRDVAYLLGWCHIKRRQWDDAVRALSPLLDATDIDGDQETLLERERMALYLLRLGLAAVNLARYEDASLHFTICLKVLHDRRVHLPSVRIKAHYSLAMTCIMRGLYTTAIQHYEEALRLCRHYNEEEEPAHIYHGLSEAYRRIGDFVKASLIGRDALRLYQERADRRMEAQMHNMLGSICFLLSDFKEAFAHYTESLALAKSYNGPTLIMLNYVALAELRMAEGRMEEAKNYCQLALECMKHSEDAHMRGSTYHMVGRVTHEEARCTEGTQRQKLLGEAIHWFEKAKEELSSTQAGTDIAEVYGNCAEVLEELGRTQEAIECWRSAYEVLAHAKGNIFIR